jgi:hypothetical protein
MGRLSYLHSSFAYQDLGFSDCFDINCLSWSTEIGLQPSTQRDFPSAKKLAKDLQIICKAKTLLDCEGWVPKLVH